MKMKTNQLHCERGKNGGQFCAILVHPGKWRRVSLPVFRHAPHAAARAPSSRCQQMQGSPRGTEPQTALWPAPPTPSPSSCGDPTAACPDIERPFLAPRARDNSKSRSAHTCTPPEPAAWSNAREEDVGMPLADGSIHSAVASGARHR